MLVEGENLRDEVAAATERAPIRLALNAVGGENALAGGEDVWRRTARW